MLSTYQKICCVPSKGKCFAYLPKYMLCTYQTSTFCKQTLQNLKRRRILWCQVWFFTICRCPIKSTLCLYGFTPSVFLFSALCIQIGAGVFGRSRGCHATSPQDEIAWSWSLALSLTSVVLLCVVVFLFLVEELRGCRNRAKQQKGKGNNLRMTIT